MPAVHLPRPSSPPKEVVYFYIHMPEILSLAPVLAFVFPIPQLFTLFSEFLALSGTYAKGMMFTQGVECVC